MCLCCAVLCPSKPSSLLLPLSFHHSLIPSSCRLCSLSFSHQRSYSWQECLFCLAESKDVDLIYIWSFQALVVCRRESDTADKTVPRVNWLIQSELKGHRFAEHIHALWTVTCKFVWALHVYWAYYTGIIWFKFDFDFVQPSWFCSTIAWTQDLTAVRPLLLSRYVGRCNNGIQTEFKSREAQFYRQWKSCSSQSKWLAKRSPNVIAPKYHEC